MGITEAEINGTEEYLWNFCLCWSWYKIRWLCKLWLTRFGKPGGRQKMLWDPRRKVPFEDWQGQGKCPRDDGILPNSWKTRKEFSRWARTRIEGPNRGNSCVHCQLILQESFEVSFPRVGVHAGLDTLLAPTTSGLSLELPLFFHYLLIAYR